MIACVLPRIPTNPDGNEGVTSSRLTRKQLIFILKGCQAVKEEEAKRNSLPLGLNVLRCNVVTVAAAGIFSKRHLRALNLFFPMKMTSRQKIKPLNEKKNSFSFLSRVIDINVPSLSRTTERIESLGIVDGHQSESNLPFVPEQQHKNFVKKI